MDTLLQVIFALLALGVLIFIHELGHYWVALRLGMIVEVFSIGFGRPIASWMHRDVRWQIGWIPFGGYVKIAGMELGKRTDLPGGFFTKQPWQRLLVAFAGPFANLLLAFALFTLIWLSGGREKPFSEFSNRIGWVDPSSELYQEGVRPGDLIRSYNGHPYTGARDLLYATILSDRPLLLSGDKVNENNFDLTPFSLSLTPYQAPKALDGVRSVGMLSPAGQLIYSQQLPASLPLQSGDRLVWADGSVLYSSQQLSNLLNTPHILLSIERAGKTVLVSVPRMQLADLKVPLTLRGELSDWQHLASIKTKLSQLYFIPYDLSTDLVVEGPLAFIEQSPTAWHETLQKGDKIVAAYLQPIASSQEFLSSLQAQQVALVVQRGVKWDKDLSWQSANERFNQKPFLEELHTFIEHPTEQGHLVLLTPIPLKPLDQHPELQEQLAQQKAYIDAISDPQKRAKAQQLFSEEEKKLFLGVSLQDAVVRYNPAPWTLFSDVLQETWQTLASLVTGQLNPKWLSGPVGIIQVIQHSWAVGFKEALFWIATISINLGFLNLLPIPVLDGGYILLSLFEIVTRKRIQPKVLEKLIIPFVVLLISFLLFVTYWDLLRLF